MLKGDMVVCNVQDMERAVKFYRDALGMTLLDESDSWTELDAGGLKVGLHLTEGGRAVPTLPKGDHLEVPGWTPSFSVTDIHAAAARMRSFGVKFLGDIFVNPWGSLVVIEDPDGNVIHIVQHGAETQGQ